MSFSRNSNLLWRTTALRRLQTAIVGVALTAVFAAPEAYAQRGGVPNQQAVNVVPITITGVSVVDGGLVANGLVGTTPFAAPITLTPEANPDPTATCPVLNLALNPINLGLLGLNVDTSAICLDITAQRGGGLLGDLLCSVANLLNGGVDLGAILAGLSPAEVSRLTNGLTQVLNQVFSMVTSSQAVVAASCTVLNLALGPIDLSLLGLRVELDNCADPAGPVTVDVTATPGGGLLGDLLCNLTNLLNGGAGTGTGNAIPATLSRIAQVIGGMVG